MKFAIIATIFGMVFTQQLTFGHKQPLNNINNTNKPPFVNPLPIQNQPNRILPPSLPTNPTLEKNRPLPQKSKSVPPPRILNQIYQQSSPVSFYPQSLFNNYQSQKTSRFDGRRFNSLDRNPFPVIPNVRKNIKNDRRKLQRYDDSDSQSNIYDRRVFRQTRDWRDFRNTRNNQRVETSFSVPMNFDINQNFNFDSRNFRPINQERTFFEPIEFYPQMNRNIVKQFGFYPVDFRQREVVTNTKLNEFVPKIDQKLNDFRIFSHPTQSPAPQYSKPFFINKLTEYEYSVPNILRQQEPRKTGPFMSSKNSFN